MKKEAALLAASGRRGVLFILDGRGQHAWKDQVVLSDCRSGVVGHSMRSVCFYFELTKMYERVRGLVSHCAAESDRC